MDNFKTTTGRDTFAEQAFSRAATPSMSESWNPHALPFQPGNFPRQEPIVGAFQNQFPQNPSHPLPHGHTAPHRQSAMTWNSIPPPPPNRPVDPPQPPPPPPPPPMVPQHPHMYNNQLDFHAHAIYQTALAQHQWMVANGHVPPTCLPPPPPYPTFQTGAQMQPHSQQSYGPPPYGYPPPYGPTPFMHQRQPQMFPNRAHYSTMQSQANARSGGEYNGNTYGWEDGVNEQVQQIIKSLSGAIPSMNYANSKYRLRAPKKKSKSAKKKKELAPFRIDLHAATQSFRIDKFRRISTVVTYPPPTAENKIDEKNIDEKKPSDKKGRYGDQKIMLPAPQPTQEYMDQAAGEPSASETPGQILVILDLNGTLLFRPGTSAQTMVARPFLQPFLRYLFENFKVMVWSSARPDNVKSLVSKALHNDFRSKLVAQWGRDSFGLSPTNYAQNVQVYKNLKLVWSRSQIQSYHPDYDAGSRFGQHNTVLIDDSPLKASAQPYNLLEIPEFSATPEQMEGDVLREVAGYLEALRWQTDVSRFIKVEPFNEGGQWTFDWPDAAAGGGEMANKATAAATATAPSKKKKNKKKLAREAAAATATTTNIPLLQTIDSLTTVSLTASIQKDW
ncbi:phospho phosphatase [Pyrenophora seminiperda CCB06]|uniref:Phospho phosphatase n=1 Tax=Pyrenophora seminiperda CCB06 TaxID=1302712 RepID=A0A3M7LYM7_9PLEO|nr:phospho phosphatase [Pyrenophora seminiperda CCB06]